MIAWRDMLVTSRDRIQKLVNEGKTEQEVPGCEIHSGTSTPNGRRTTKQAKELGSLMAYNSFKWS